MYDQGFYIVGERGNNAFSYAERGKNPRLYVPAVIDGGLEDLRAQTDEKRVAFEDFDEHGNLQTCLGLENFVRMELAIPGSERKVPAVVVDNHNHAFYFWWEAASRGLIKPGVELVHVDQHKDMREAAEPYLGQSLEEAFEYTNYVLNVGNYIRPAMDCGLIGEVRMVTGEADLEAVDSGRVSGVNSKILNLDLDFFAPEMDYIDFEKARGFVLREAAGADFITIATSPFFIEQGLAVLRF
jgi:hypothetical protein